MGHGSSTSKPLPPPSEAAREAAEARREAEKRQRGTGDGSGDAGNDGASQPKRSRRSDEGRESSSNNADAEPTGPSGNARNNGASEPEISRHSDEEEEQVEESHSSRNASARPSGASVSRETLTERRSLIAEQNRAFENSLRADQQKAMEKLEKERAVAVKEKKKQEKIAAFQKRKREARESLSEEPDAEDPGVITLAFHMPSGRSIKRGFRQTDTLKVRVND